MFFQKRSSLFFSSDWLFQFLHSIRLHQLVYQLTLVFIILFFSPLTTTFQILSAFVLIILITPSFLLLQDILGKKDDEKVGQKRILFSNHVNKIFFFFSFALMVLILFLNNVFSLIFYLLLLISTISYAAMKHFHQMFFAYVFRYLSSIFTFLIYVFLLIGSLSSFFFDLLVFISLLDLVGNIAGDIRDSAKDYKAGIKTLVTTKGKDFTIFIMAFLVLCSFIFLIFKYYNIIFILLLFCNGIPFVIVNYVPARFAHGVFHYSKLFNYLFIAFLLSSIDIFVFFSVLAVITLFWFISYYLYLYNAK